MLRLKEIKKEYDVADLKVEALKGISLSFRKNEFVSILGPSGCGKTTTLNIIGGLDKYTSGDLIISGRSTKEFSGRDWDVYRNHRIGFVFQSYNLIPHQTVLGNVELALTISGITKEERRTRAKNALEKVGLAAHLKKHPNQLSGGQCQRVAIARALVNNPEILLADEPTGALDTETSIQIMELIKEIAKDRLVIMVTHNPELALKYSTRIVKLLDGQVLEDSNPLSEEDEIAECESVNKDLIEAEVAEEEVLKAIAEKNGKKYKKKSGREKAKMSWWTAFKLSARNLVAKWKRTLMVCIAGSIGIVGVSLVLAVSNGVHGYIDDMQEDMLSGNPLTVSETSFNLEAMMGTMNDTEKAKYVLKNGTVNVDSLIEYLAGMVSGDNAIQIENNITQEYIDYLKAMPKEYYSVIMENYGIDFANNIYTGFDAGMGSEERMSLTNIRRIYTDVLKNTEFGEYSSYIATLGSVMSQIIPNEEYVMSQYDLLYGDHYATKENEIMIVVDEDETLTDLTLAQLGYFTEDEFMNIAYRVGTDKTGYDSSLDVKEFSYDKLLGKSFTWYPNNALYNKNNDASTKNNMPFIYNNYESSITDKTDALELKVVGILKPKKDVNYGALERGFFYTSALADKMLATSANSDVVKYLKTLPDETANNLDMEKFMDDPSHPENAAGQVVGFAYHYRYDDKRTTEDDDSTYYTGSSCVGTPSQMVQGYITLSAREVGGNSMSNHISVYPSDFDHLSNIREYLDLWNEDGDITVNGVVYTKAMRDEIKYTDNMTVIVGMINTMINMITYALIAFTALSLVVSTVMIGIITYVSVVERVKEIGVIRSLGGRKKDVSHLFNAETFIIGFISGALGVIITYLLSLVLNLSLGSAVGIPSIASLPILQAIIMIIISILLTLISGLIPARSAAKKDPVVALRSE